MKLDRIFKLFDEVFGVLELLFVLTAGAFGAWLVWTLLSGPDVSLVLQIGASLAGAAVCAVLMRLVLAVLKLFN